MSAFTYKRLNIFDWTLHLVPVGELAALCGCVPTFEVRGLALRPTGICDHCDSLRRKFEVQS